MVPLRWPVTTAAAGGMIGELGALRGYILPLVLSQSRQHFGSYQWGYTCPTIIASDNAYSVQSVCRRPLEMSWFRPIEVSGSKDGLDIDERARSEADRSVD